MSEFGSFIWLPGVFEIIMVIRIHTGYGNILIGVIGERRTYDVLVDDISRSPDIPLLKPYFISHPARLQSPVKTFHRVNVLQLTSFLKTRVIRHIFLNSLIDTFGYIIHVHIMPVFMHVQAIENKPDSKGSASFIYA